jgi:hypothetical protein
LRSCRAATIIVPLRLTILILIVARLSSRLSRHSQLPRTRTNVMAAIAALMSRPSAAVWPWGLPGDPFEYLTAGLDDRQRDSLERSASAWPGYIATPVLRALQKS